MTTRSLMIAVALVAWVLLAIRSESEEFVGLCIVSACVLVMARARTAEVVIAHRLTTRAQVVSCFLQSLAIAVQIIIVSDSVFLIIIAFGAAFSLAVAFPLVLVAGAAVAVLVASRLKRLLWSYERASRSSPLERFTARLRRMTKWRLLAAVTVVVLGVGWDPAITVLRTFCIRRALPHEQISSFAWAEQVLFAQRAATCRRWAAEGIPWDRDGEEAETLKLCPDQWEAPEHGSWAAQAEGWDRAAARARIAETRQSRIAAAYMLWGAIDVVHFVTAERFRIPGLGVSPLAILVLYFGLWLCFRTSRQTSDGAKQHAPDPAIQRRAAMSAEHPAVELGNRTESVLVTGSQERESSSSD